MRGNPPAAPWPWYVLMNEVLGLGPSDSSRVIIVFIPEDSPGPGAAVSDQEENRERKGWRQAANNSREEEDEELLDLIRENVRQQRETEESKVEGGWTDFFYFKYISSKECLFLVKKIK